MAKPWAKLEIGYSTHPKFMRLSANAFALWHEAKDWCAKYQTDGLIPKHALKLFRFYSKKSVELLTTSCGLPSNGEQMMAPLWEAHDVGYKMHDYLDHNDCREEVLSRIEGSELKRFLDRRRMQLWRNKELTSRIRERDGASCRYCYRIVNWSDRRGADAATYDHVDPNGDNSFDNVVVACKGCNSAKHARTPEEANMPLRPPRPTTDQLRSTTESTARSRNAVDSRRETATATATATSQIPKEQVSGTDVRARAPLHASHKNHAHCGRVCLHASLYSEFVRRRNHPDAEREIDTWALEVEREWGPDGPRGQEETGDAFDFWRARYAEKWPPSQAALGAKPKPVAPDPYVSWADHPSNPHRRVGGVQ